MKKALIFLLLVSCLSSAAQADVLWEPYGEDAATEFYEEHRAELAYTGRQFLCDGYDGVVRGYTSPEDLTVLETFATGETLWIYYIYTGEALTWGLYGKKDQQGWIPMDDLALIYDNESFCEDHASEITGYDGSYDSLQAGYLWTYPRSGQLYLSAPWETVPEYFETFGFSKTYVDEEGELWCYVAYYMGDHGWICVTDPMNADIAAVEVEQVRSVAQQEGHVTISAEQENTAAEEHPASSAAQQMKEAESSADSENLELVIALVVAVIGVTAVLIAVFWKRRK